MMRLSSYFGQILLEPDDSTHNSPADATTATVAIARLLSDAYESYPHITRQNIEKKRLHHRLQVVQNLEDTAQKNVLRSVHKFSSSLTPEELKALFLVVKNDQLERNNTQNYHIPDPNERLDPTLPYYELYKADYGTFRKLFLAISPWGQGEEMGLVLSERLFRLMDANHDSLINFKEIVQVII
jgi:hypothetical protein